LQLVSPGSQDRAAKAKAKAEAKAKKESEQIEAAKAKAVSDQEERATAIKEGQNEVKMLQNWRVARNAVMSGGLQNKLLVPSRHANEDPTTPVGVISPMTILYLKHVRNNASIKRDNAETSVGRTLPGEHMLSVVLQLSRPRKEMTAVEEAIESVFEEMPVMNEGPSVDKNLES